MRLKNSKIEFTKTLYLSDIEMERVLWVLIILFFPSLIFFGVSCPSLKNCQIFSKELVDPLLVNTYKELRKLPR